jgi:hypothetical protein
MPAGATWTWSRSSSRRPSHSSAGALAWDLSPLPVPAEILIHTRDEWQRMEREGGRFMRTLAREARWLAEPEPSA